MTRPRIKPRSPGPLANTNHYANLIISLKYTISAFFLIFEFALIDKWMNPRNYWYFSLKFRFYIFTAVGWTVETLWKRSKSCHLFPVNKWNKQTLMYNLLTNHLSFKGAGIYLNLLVYIEDPKREPLKKHQNSQNKFALLEFVL